MKSLLSLLFLLVAAASAEAASRYANSYVGFIYQYGDLVAGVNVTIDGDGAVTGRGTYLDFTEINLAGTVSDAGTLSLVEADGDGRNDAFSFTAHFTPNGKKFVARTGNGYVFRAKKISGNFPQAGTYYLHDDAGEDAVVLMNRNGLVYGVIYGYDGDTYELDGTANANGFDATAEDGVDYSADFDGDDFFGSYDDGAYFYGDFEGSRY